MTTRAWSFIERELEIRLGFTPANRADLVAAAKEVERGNWHISDAEIFLRRVYRRWYDDRRNRMRLAGEYMRETAPRRFVTEDGPLWSTASFDVEPSAISEETREAARQLAFNAGQQIAAAAVATGLMIPKELLEPTPEPKPAIENALPLGGRRIRLE